MGQPVVHFEFWSEDPQKASEFYSTVFGWQIRNLPEMNYRLVDTGGKGGINGGIMTPQKGPWPGNMTFYIDVDDLEVYRSRITNAGGTVVVDRMEVPGVGWLMLFEDTDKRVIGLWQQLPQPRAELGAQPA
jgi:predicted enzyme related to lactoylglutathione lyase